MDINEFVKNFAAELEETPAEMIAADTEFRQLDEWTSYVGLSIMAMVADEYDVMLSAQDFRNAKTVQDLFNLVSSKQ